MEKIVGAAVLGAIVAMIVILRSQGSHVAIWHLFGRQAHMTHKPRLSSNKGLQAGRWSLQRGQDILGVLTQVDTFSGDQNWVWLLCRFEPAPDYGYYAALFKEEARLMEINEYGLCKPYTEGIARLGLKLVPLASQGEPMNNFTLHIDNNEAWFHAE